MYVDEAGGQWVLVVSRSATASGEMFPVHQAAQVITLRGPLGERV